VYHQKDSLSQNFIKHKSLVEELILASDIDSNDTVIEIGPGRGIITKALCKKAKQVIAIEKDTGLADKLVGQLEESNVKVVNQDFLTYHLPKTEYKIFANIPFSITSEIVNHIMSSPVLPQSMYLIMQKEAGDKFAGGSLETLSSVATKPFFEIETLGEIDRTNFTLKPQVKIVFVRFTKREKTFINENDRILFRHFVNYGFTRWKPTVMEAYKKVMTYNQSININKMLKIGNIKPSELSFDKWLLLFKTWRKLANDTQIREIRTA
jgi:23S rRNA (adenine-N6)-dimethyltransferase